MECHVRVFFPLLTWGFPKIEVPQNGTVKIMEKPYLLVDDLGGKPIIFGNTLIGWNHGEESRW